MNLYTITLNNIIRKKTRVLLVICSLIASIATVVALLVIVDSMRLALGDQIDEFGANIVIVPRVEGMEISYGGTHISRTAIDLTQLSEADLDRIKEIPDYDSINLVSAKMVTAVKANEQDLLLVGINPRQEFVMKPWFSFAGQAGLNGGEPPGDPAIFDLAEDGLIAGADAALVLGASAGDRVMINGRPFIIAAILNQLGSVEDGLLYANLTAVQNLLGRPGEISMIEIAAYCNACPVEELAAQLSEVLPNGRVTALRQAALLREETINRFAVFSILLSATVLLVAALLILTTMMASVHERTLEIGIFRAIGFRAGHVMVIILLESGLIGILGGVAGFITGNLVARAVGPFLVDNAVAVTWQTQLLMPAVLLSVLLALSATFYPALRAARLDPVEALRFI